MNRAAGLVIAAVVGALIVEAWGLNPLSILICVAAGAAIGVISMRSS